MGTDIFTNFEIRFSGAWVRMKLEPYVDGDTASPEEMTAALTHPLDLGRNYEMFAILAGIRNRDGVQPIAEPRGLPGDVSSAVRTYWEHCGDSAQGTAWFLLSELLDFNWEKPFPQPNRYRHHTYGEAAEPLVSVALPFLQSLVDDPRNLRMVFWFDG